MFGFGNTLSNMINKKINEALDKLIIESSGPKVGIFWIVDNNIIAMTDESRNIPSIAGFKNTDKDHYSEWGKVKRSLNLTGEYTDFPRGRVLLDVNNRKFIVFLPKRFADDKPTINKISREFSLPINHISIKTDAHYEDLSDEDWDNM